MKYKFFNLFVLAVLILASGSFLNPTPAEGAALCSSLGVPTARIVISGQYGGTFESSSANPDVTASISVPSGTVLSSTFYTFAEPNSPVVEAWPMGRSQTYTGPSSIGRAHTTDAITGTTSFSISLIQYCQDGTVGPVGPFGPDGSITVNVNVVPVLSCAVDTVATPAPHYTNSGVKFLATGGTGTYSWTATGGTPSSGTGNQIWPSYSTTGTKTVSVTSGTQTATCNVDITSAPAATHTATASVLGVGGSVTSPNTVSNISNGSFASFTVAPAQNYSIDTTLVGGGCPQKFPLSSAWVGSTYSTDNFSVTDPANCTVNFSFIENSVAIPTTPTGLTASAGACGTGMISVSWNPVSGATSYQLRDGTTIIYNGSGTSYSHTGLTAGSSHSYTVRATNASGSSAYSSAVSRTAPAVCAAPMSGTLTPSPTSCSIPASSYSCTKLLTWTTTNPVAVSAVTSATGTPSPSTWANNGSQTFTIPYNNGADSMFYLYNNGVLLATASVTPYCVAGTEWSGIECVTIVNPMSDLTASAPTPNIATVNVARTFSSDISNIGGASTGASFANFFQVASAANGGGTITSLASATTTALTNGSTRTITSPSHTFASVGTYSVRACADLPPQSTGVIAESNETNNCSAWTNVTVSATAGTVAGYHDAYSGTVVASQCRADGWARYSADLGLDLNIKILSDGVQVATGVASIYRSDLETAGICTGGTCGYAINLSGLISSGTNHTITAQAQNPSTMAWTTLDLSPKTLNCAAATTGTLSAPNCKIKSGESSCNTGLTWTTTNPVGTSNITSNTPSANTIITTGNSGTNFSASVPYSSRTFFLNNNSVTLASVTPTATCDSGLSWDADKEMCVTDSTPSCTPISLVSGSVSPTTVSYGEEYTVSCDYGVTSGYIGAIVGSSSGSCTWAGFTEKTTIANFGCTSGFAPGSFNNSCVINDSAYCSSVDRINDLRVTTPPPGSSIPGSCGTPNMHYKCAIGASANNTNGISSWTWSCLGQNGGATDLCEESKKKPVIIED